MPQAYLIAIIDDDQAVRDALFDLLEVEGLAARTFGSATAFLAHQATEEFDCLITDVHMPDIDGFELQEQLRAIGKTIPMIFITSSTNENMRARALRNGAVAWFIKPVEDEALLHAIRMALDENGTSSG